MEVKIERFDDLGQGVCFVDKKVTFVPNTVPGDIVDIKLTKIKKNYNEAILLDVLVPSHARIPYKCPYFLNCGGCQLQTISYKDTLQYKLNKVTSLFTKNKIDVSFLMEDNPSPYNYRNKINLKVEDGKIGFYLNNTHLVVEINKCLIASEVINDVISFVKDFNIINGNVTIRCNQEKQVLIIIESNDNLNIDVDLIKQKIDLVGIVINKNIYYGIDYLYENINGLIFKISYDSFFQVNPYVASKLFKIISDNVCDTDKVMDLYCGVGTLSLSAARIADEVVGVELVENAIANAKENARINGLDNVTFILNDVSDEIDKFNTDFTKVIVDPPRSGLSRKVIDFLSKIMPEEIIYVSCDPQTLVRDYKLLQKYYKIKKCYALDMFSFTHHLESVLILKRIDKYEIN